MVYGGGVLSTHAGPILVRPEVCVLTPRYWDLVPELGPEPVEGLGLSHGQGNLNTLDEDPEQERRVDLAHKCGQDLLKEN